MRRIVILLALVIAAVALLVRWCSGPDDMPSKPGAGLAPETAPRVGGPAGSDGDGAEVRTGGGTAPRQEPPRLPPSGSTPRVTFEQGPMRPDEDPRRYDDRVWFTRRFEAFEREAKLTPRQREAVLLALYDAVEAKRPLWKIAAEDRASGKELSREWASALFGPSNYEILAKLQDILTSDQVVLWYRHCAICAQRLSQMVDYDEPVLRLEPNEGR